ncbi:MAG: DNA primase [Oscillospiraceae bacterium]|jgi:DNA primase|nr:DNA primase [Oscillospiraceae bacterium]
MAIPDSFIDELVARTDIAEVVSSYVKLTKRSGANEFGLCPFHSEKTPSFSINRDKQAFYCFGCGRGGGVINFIREIENLSFREAVDMLAKRAGMTVPETDGRERTEERRRMLDLNRDAARFYHDTLAAARGGAAASYMRSRGISPRMARMFGLGAAPDSWDALLAAMKGKGYGEGELVDAGLARRGKNGAPYDYFRDRLIFPVIDVRGGVIGFSGRALADGGPKYLNSPDTRVFSKSRNLFALNLAKKSKAGMLILTEGNIDVVSLHGAGVDCAVASLGTSLTGEQARLMTRYTDKAVICYDNDEAGQKATERAIGILEKTGLNVRVLRLGGAKDPDEYVRKYGGDSFLNLLDKSENHMEYRLRSILSEVDMKTDEGRVSYLTRAVEALADVPSAAEREVFGRTAAKSAGVSYEAVENEVRKQRRALAKKEKSKLRRAEERPDATVQPDDRALRYENEYSAVAEEGVVRCLFSDPETFKAVREADLKPEEFTSEFLGRVYARLLERDGADERAPPSAILAALEPSEASHLTKLLRRPSSKREGVREMRDYIERIREERLKSEGDITAALIAVQKIKQRKEMG